MITLHAKTLRMFWRINYLLAPLSALAVIFNRELPDSSLVKLLGYSYLLLIGFSGATLALGEKFGFITVIVDEKEKRRLTYRMKSALDEMLGKGR